MRVCLQCKLPFTPNPIGGGGAQQKFCCYKCRDQYRYDHKRKGTIEHCINAMLSSSKHRAKKFGLLFSITKKDIIIPKSCPVFSIQLHVHTGKKQDDSPSLDKIDPSKGYVPNNICVISNKANRLKNKMTLEEIKALARYVEERIQ